LRPEPVIVVPYYEYQSPRGSLGVSKGAIITVPGDELVIKWYRSGRLYGAAPEGITRYTVDGGKEELDFLPDGLEAINELEPLDT